MSQSLIKAYGITQFGPVAEVVKQVEVAKPEPGPRDLLVRVLAVATNPVDVKKASGLYDKLAGGGAEVASPPCILGWDASGVVEAVGSEASLFKPGDEVFFAGSIARQGCFAEYTLVDERIVGSKPASISHEAATALPLTSLTAWEMMVEEFGIPIPSGHDTINQNKSLLVLGGAGGVGSIAIQIAKKVLKIGRVIASASRPETIEFSKKFGADDIINHRKPLTEELSRLGIKGVDYIFNTSDPDAVIDQLVDIVNPLGKIGHILPITKQFNTRPLFGKRAALCFELMFTRSVTGVEMEKQGAILNRVAELIDAKVLHSTANNHFPLNKIVEALALQDSGNAIGKIVLSTRTW